MDSSEITESPVGSEFFELYGCKPEDRVDDRKSVLAAHTSGSYRVRSKGAYFKWRDLEDALQGGGVLSHLYQWMICAENPSKIGIVLKLKTGSDAAKDRDIRNFIVELENLQVNFLYKLAGGVSEYAYFESKAACKSYDVPSKAIVSLERMVRYQAALAKTNGTKSKSFLLEIDKLKHEFRGFKQESVICMSHGFPNPLRKELCLAIQNVILLTPDLFLAAVSSVSSVIWLEAFEQLLCMLKTGETLGSVREFVIPGLHSKALETNEAFVNRVLTEAIERLREAGHFLNSLKTSPLAQVFSSGSYIMESSYEYKLLLNRSIDPNGPECVSSHFISTSHNCIPHHSSGSTLKAMLAACKVASLDILVIENRTPFLVKSPFIALKRAEFSVGVVRPLLIVNGEGNRITGAVNFFDAIASVAKINQVFYWGDMDNDGYAILGRFRAMLQPQGLTVKSILMDLKTLQVHLDCLVRDEGSRTAGRLDFLTSDERVALSNLKGSRLEQEAVRL